MTIQDAVNNFKDLIEKSIESGGSKAKTAMIRSSKPILNIHEAVKHELIKNGIDGNNIFPPINARSPELKIAGALKKKDQDICIVPNVAKQIEILKDGLLDGVEDEFGFDYTQRTISINVRSQISSIQKNFDTLYERTISEAQNLHDRCPKMVLGEVYMIAVPEYDDKKFDSHVCQFKSVNTRLVEKYIKSFQAINSRHIVKKNFYKYEAVCLLIVDFRDKIPTIYSTKKELIKAGLLDANSNVTMQNLSWDTFISNLLEIYRKRFDNKGGVKKVNVFLR